MDRGRTSRGFTLIELMVVVAIIGLLAAVSLPAYQDYVSRSRFAEVSSMGQVGRQAVAEYYARWGKFPADNAQAGLAPPDAYAGHWVRGMHVRDGALRIETDKMGADRRSLYLRPIVNRDNPTGPLAWTCTPTDPKPGERFEVVGKAGTDVPQNKFLPGSCR